MLRLAAAPDRQRRSGPFPISERASYASPATCGIGLSSATVRQYGLQRCEACREIHALVDVLLQKLLHARPECDGVIDSRITAALVGSDRNEVAVLLIGGKYLTELTRDLHLRWSADLVHRPADGRLDVYCRIMAAFRNAA